jgi:hypothetical protein
VKTQTSTFSCFLLQSTIINLPCPPVCRKLVKSAYGLTDIILMNNCLADRRSTDLLLYGGKTMNKEYDFSKGERGKFYKPNVKLNIPVYLDSVAYSFVEKIAEKKQEDVSTIVNKLIKTDKRIADMTQ